MLTNNTTSATTAKSATLLPHHREELYASGLNDETIESAGIYSETNRGLLAKLLNRRSWPSTWGNGLVFPFVDQAGQTVLSRVKPDNPPKQRGSLRKYIQPSGVPVRVYIPTAARNALHTDGRIFITEGEKKSLCLSQNGFIGIGLTGVECWHSAGSNSLLADLEAMNWSREVYIVFDSDAVDNENVRRNESLLAMVLQQRKSRVHVVRIPPGDDGQKQGVDDFIVANGASAFQKLVATAEEPEKPEAGQIKMPAKSMDAADEAVRFCTRTKTERGVQRLRHWKGKFAWWSHGQYMQVDDDEIHARVTEHLNASYFQMSRIHICNVVDQVKSATIVTASNAPTWLRPRTPDDWVVNEILATRDRLIHLPSFVDGMDENSREATPRFLTFSSTNFPFDPNPPKPVRWIEFLKQLWPDDAQAIATLQNWFGYCLVADTCQQKILLIVGPPRSGKGTIARVLTELVGPDNVAAPTLSSIAGQFGLWPLLNRTVAIISDARLSGRADQAATVERLLSISGEDRIDVDRKCLQPVSTKIGARLMMLSNELPRLTDASGAMAERFILLRLRNSFVGHENTGLTTELLKELPGILIWAIAGWKMLRDQGRFMQPDASLELLAEMRDLGSPVKAFVRDCCELDSSATIRKSELYAEWRTWAEDKGHRFQITEETFGRDLLAAFPQLTTSRPRDGGSRFWAYAGIRLRLD